MRASVVWVALALSVFTLGQVAAAADDSEQQAAIAKAVERLGDKQFSVREAASKYLWQQGDAALAALRKAATSPDREVRTRAKKILSDFESGIRPSVSAAELAWIRAFRDGNAQQQLLVLKEVVAQDRFDVLVRLLKNAPQFETRQQMVLALANDDETVAKLATKGRIQKIADQLAADQEAGFQSPLVGQFHFLPLVLKHLVENERLDEALAFIKNETDAQLRRSRIQSLLMNVHVVKFYLDKKQLDALLRFVTLEPDADSRGGLLGNLFANQLTGTLLVEQGHFEAVLKFSRENLNWSGRAAWFVQFSDQQKLMSTLLEKYGIKPFIKLLAEEQDDDARGKILGALLSNDTVWQQLHEGESPTLWLKIVQEQPSIITRRVILRTLTERGRLQRALANDESFKQLWEIIRTDDNREWQLAMATQLFSLHNMEQKFTTKQDRHWLLELINGKPTPERVVFLQQLFGHGIILNNLIEDGHFDTLLSICKTLPDAERGTMLARFFALANALRELEKSQRLPLILALWRDEKTASVKEAYLRQIASNNAVVTVLIQHDSAQELVGIINSLEDAKTKAQMLATLFQHPRILQQWIEQKKLDEVLAIGRDAPDAETRRAYCQQLFRAHHALNVLVENDRFENLIALWRLENDKNIQLTLLAQLIAVPKVAPLLAKEPLGAEILKLIDGSENSVNSREQFLSNLFNSQNGLSAFAAAGHSDKLWLWARTPKEKYLVTSRVQQLFAVPAAIKQLLANNSIDKLLADATKDLSVDKRRELIQQFFFNDQTIALILKEKQLDGLLNMAAEVQDGNSLLRVLTRPQVLKELEASKKLGMILDLRAKFAEGEQANISYAQQLVQHTPLMDTLLRNGFRDQVVALIANEPNPVHRIRLINVALGQLQGTSLFAKLVQELKLGDQLLAYAETDKDVGIRIAARRAIFQQSAFLHQLSMTQFDRVFKLATAEDSGELQGIFLATLMTTPSAVKTIVDQGLLADVWKKIRNAKLDDNTRNSLPYTLAQNRQFVDALIANNEIEALVAFVNQGQNGATALGLLYGQPRVIKHLISQHGGDGFVKLLRSEFDTNARRSILQRIVFDDEAIKLLLEHDQFVALLDFAAGSSSNDDPFNEPFNNGGNGFLGQLFGRPAFLNWLTTNKKLPMILERLSADTRDTSRRANVRSLLSNPEILQAFAAQQQLPELWKFVSDEKDEPTRTAWQTQILANKQVVDWLLKNRDFKTLLETVKRPQALFESTSMLAALVDRGDFDALWKTATDQESAAVRSNLLGRLLTVPAALKQLEKSERFDDVWKVVSTADASTPELKSLQKSLLSNPDAITSLLAKGHFETLATWAKKQTPQRQYFVGFYTHTDVVKHLIDKQGAAAYLKIFQLADADVRRAFLQRLIHNQPFFVGPTGSARPKLTPELLSQLVAADLLLPLLEMTKDFDEPWGGGNRYEAQLLTHRAVTNWALEKNRLGFVLTRLKKISGDDNLQNSLQQLLYPGGERDETKMQKVANQLWQMALKETDQDIRRSFFQVLLSESTIADRAVKKYGCDGFVELLGGPDLIFANAQLLHLLVTGGQFESLWKLAQSAKEPADRAKMLGQLLLAPEALPLLKKSDRMDEVWKIVSAEGAQDPAITEIRQRLLLDDAVVSELIARGHFETLSSWVRKDRSSSFNLGRFLTQPSTVKYLIEKRGAAEFMKIIAEEKDDSTRIEMANSLFQQPASLDLLIEQDQFETLLKYGRVPRSAFHGFNVVDGRQIPYHSLTLIFHNSSSINALAKKKQLGSLLKFMVAEPDDDIRFGFASSAVGRTEYHNSSPTAFVKALLDNGQIEDLWKWATTDSHEPIRRVLVPGILKSQAAMDWLRKGKSIDELLKTFDKDEVMFSTKSLLEILVADNRFEKLWQRASTSADEKRRGLYVSKLALVVPGQTFVQKPELVVEFWKLVQASQLNATEMQEVSQAFVGVPPLLDTLLEKGQLNELIAWAASSKESTAWTTLVVHPKIVQAKIKRDGAAEYMKWITTSDNRYASSALYPLVGNPACRSLLIDGGQLDALLKLIESPPYRANRTYLLQQLNQVPKVAAELAKRPDIKLPPPVIRETKASNQQLLLDLRYNSPRMQAWLKENSWDALLKLADEIKSPTQKPTLKQQLLVSGGVAAYFGEKGDLEPWLAELRKERDWEWQDGFFNSFMNSSQTQQLLNKPEVAAAIATVAKETTNDVLRQRLAQRVLGMPPIRQALIKAGKEETLKELLATLSNHPLRPTYETQLFYSPAGLFGHHILNDRFDEAEKLLRQNLYDDVGRSRWIAYLVATNKLVDEIKRVTPAEANNNENPNPRLLLQLHRANGDFATAQKFLTPPEDRLRRHQLFSESRNWKAAADALINNNTTGDLTYTIERLGYLAAYHRLAGNRDAADVALLEIRNSVKEKSPLNARWYAAKALLLQEQWDAALPLLEKADPPKAFALYRQRSEFAKALRMVGAEPGTTFDQNWFDKHLAIPKHNMWPTAIADEFAVDVAALLQRVGRKEDADKVLALLETQFAKNDKNVNSSGGNEPIVRAMVALTRQFGIERAAPIMEKFLAPVQQSATNSMLFPNENIPASQWDNWLRNLNPASTTADRLTQVDRLLKGQLPPEEFERLAQFAEEQIQRLTMNLVAANSASSNWTLGRVYATYQRFEDARRCLEKAAPHIIHAEIDLIKTLRQLKDWPAAAQRAEASFERDRNQVIMLYLAGDAWQKAGESERGAKLKQQARLLSFDSRSRQLLAIELKRQGLVDESRVEHELVVKSAPIDSWEWHDAVRLLGDLKSAESPVKAADAWEQFMLNNFQPSRYLLDPEYYVKLPVLIRTTRVKVAIEAGDAKRIDAELRALIAANPGASAIALELVPLLEKAKQNAAAQNLFDQQFKFLENVCTEFPQCAAAHNNVAWLAARSRKNLDEALRHAKLAVELSPVAEHLDTLAEAHFQLGDRPAAVAQARRAAELAPKNKLRQERQKHFETAPLSQAP